MTTRNALGMQEFARPWGTFSSFAHPRRLYICGQEHRSRRNTASSSRPTKQFLTLEKITSLKSSVMITRPIYLCYIFIIYIYYYAHIFSLALSFSLSLSLCTHAPCATHTYIYYTYIIYIYIFIHLYIYT